MTYCTEKIKNREYDERNDILYVHFDNDRGNSYADEEEPGIEVMHDMDSGEVTGLMIFYPRKRRDQRIKSLNKLGYDMQIL